MRLRSVRNWSVYNDDAPSYCTIAKCFAQFKDPERGFKDSPRTGSTSTITTDENIQTVQRIVMHDGQISVCCLVYDLAIPTTTVYEIMSAHVSMKKVSTRWVRKFLTPIQYANRVDCCQELLQESEVNSDNYFHSIVVDDETWLYYYDLLSQQEVKIWKKAGEETATRLR